MHSYTLKVIKQRKLLGDMQRNFKATSKAMHYGQWELVALLTQQLPAMREAYDKVTLELAEESRILIEKGKNPYDYAPEAEYAPPDPDE